MKKVWFITGANKGLGAAIAKNALKEGNQVVAACRKTDEAEKVLGKSDNLLIVKVDITDEQMIKDAVAQAVEHFGRIDVLVNNAGYGLLGYFEEMPEEMIRAQIETNVFGTMKMTREVLPVMRRQKSGMVAIISSTSGIRSVAAGSVYSASKFALEGWGEGMNIDMKPFGIRFMIVEPGPFRTDFLNGQTSMHYPESRLEAYKESSESMYKLLSGVHNNETGNPDKLAIILSKAVESENPPLHLVIGRDAVTSIDKYYTERRNEFEQWRDIASDTDFDS